MKTRVRKRIRRINWSADENVACSFWADYGFHSDFIERMTGLNRSQISYRLRQCGKHLRDYRNGRTQVAKILIKKYKVVTPSMRATTFTPKNLYPKKGV